MRNPHDDPHPLDAPDPIALRCACGETCDYTDWDAAMTDGWHLLETSFESDSFVDYTRVCRDCGRFPNRCDHIGLRVNATCEACAVEPPENGYDHQQAEE